MGLPPEDVARLVDHAGDSANDDTLEIMAENWPTLDVFLSLSTQWRREFPAMSDRELWHGIPHSEIEPTIRLMGYAKSARRIFEGLKIMEAEALPLLNSR